MRATPDAWGELAVVSAAAAVGLAAVVGGAFHPEPRVVVGGLLALALSGAVARLRGRLRAEEMLLLGAIGWGAVAALLQPMSPFSAKVALTAWLVSVLLWMVTRRVGPSARRMVLAVLVASGALVALGVVFEFAVLAIPQAGGLLENQNVAVALLVPTMLAVAVVGREWGRGLAACLILLLAAAVVLSGSRAGVLAAAIGLVAMVPAGKVRRITCVVAVVMAVAAIGWRLTARDNPLAWHRLEIWPAVLSLVAAHPLSGVSPGALADASGVVRIAHPELIGQHQKFISYSESTPLAVLVQTGVVGLGLVTASVAVWLAGLKRRYLLASPAMRGMLACLAVLAVVHDQLGADIVLWWWALLVGALESTADPLCVGDGRTGCRARGIAAIGVGGLVLWGMVQPAVARSLWRAGPASAELAQRARLVEPWYAEPARWRTLQLLATPHWDWATAAEALHFSSEAVAARPGQAQLWADHGRVHMRLMEELGAWPGSVEAARAAFARACALEPRLPWFWFDRAWLERRVGRPQVARGLVGRAVEVEPRFVRGWLLLARLELDMGRVDQARQALDRATAASAVGRGRLLTEYERQLLFVPAARLASLEEALR